MPEKKLSGVVNTALLWIKETQYRTGLRWNNVIEKLHMGLAGDSGQALSTDNVGGYKQK